MLIYNEKKLKSNKSNKDENIMDSLHRVERVERQERGIEKAQQAYMEAYSCYVDVNRIYNTPNIFLSPFTYFVYYDNEVHYIFYKSFSLLGNVSLTFCQIFNLPCSADGKVEYNLLQKLELLLKKYGTLPKYQQLLLKYEERYHNTFPYESFLLMNGNLCYQRKYNGSTEAIYYLNAGNVKTLFGDGVKGNDIALLKALKKTDILNEFCYTKTNNPFYLYFKDNGEMIRFGYNPEKRCIDSIIPKIQGYEELGQQLVNDANYFKEKDISYLFQYTCISSRQIPMSKPSNKLVDFLFHLTKGNYSTLVNIMILCANIASPEVLTPKLFLIEYPCMDGRDFSAETIFMNIIDLVFNISMKDESIFYKDFQSINEMVQKKKFDTLCEGFFQNIRAISVSKGSERLSDIQIKTFKQYIRGSKVAALDAKFGTKYFKNTCPIICFSNRQTEISYLERNFPCLKIRLEGIGDMENALIPNPVRDKEDYEWLRWYFPLCGLFMLAEKKFYKVPLPKETKIYQRVPEDDAINDFISTFCEYATDDFIYADLLYDVYTEYCQNTYRGIPLKRTQFVSELRNISTIGYKRPHISRNEPNKYAFTGIKLKSNWKEHMHKDSSLILDEKEVFRTKLEEITEGVSEIMDKEKS